MTGWRLVEWLGLWVLASMVCGIVWAAVLGAFKARARKAGHTWQ